VAQHLRLGPELAQAQQQVEGGRRFQAWHQDVLEVNEQICRLRSVPPVKGEAELDALKKKLQKMFYRKRKKKSTG
jgi:hypothetical protein